MKTRLLKRLREEARMHYSPMFLREFALSLGWSYTQANKYIRTKLREWLNEIVAYSGLDEYLQPTGVIRRFQRIERVRRNGRGRGKAIKVVAAEIFEHFKKR